MYFPPALFNFKKKRSPKKFISDHELTHVELLLIMSMTMSFFYLKVVVELKRRQELKIPPYLCTLLQVPQNTMKVFPANSLSTDTK